MAGLSQKFNHVQVYSLAGRLHAGKPGQHDPLQLRQLFPQRGKCFQAADAGKIEIEQRDFRRLRFGLPNRFFSAPD